MNINFRSNGKQTQETPDSGHCGGICNAAALTRFFQWVRTQMGDFCRQAGEFISASFRRCWQLIGGMCTSFVDILSRVWNQFRQFMSWVWNELRQIIAGIGTICYNKDLKTLFAVFKELVLGTLMNGLDVGADINSAISHFK